MLLPEQQTFCYCAVFLCGVSNFILLGARFEPDALPAPLFAAFVAGLILWLTIQVGGNSRWLSTSPWALVLVASASVFVSFGCAYPILASSSLPMLFRAVSLFHAFTYVSFYLAGFVLFGLDGLARS